MENRDELTNAETAAFEAYSSIAARHTMLLLLGVATVAASFLGIVLAVATTIASVFGLVEPHPAFLPIAVLGMACGGIDFIATRRDNDYAAGIATIIGQGALTAAGAVALLGWFSAGSLVTVIAALLGIGTCGVLFRYPEWEAQAQLLERFVRVPGDGDHP